MTEPEDDPERVIERMEQLIETAAANREQMVDPDPDTHTLAWKHADAVRCGAAHGRADE